MGAKSKTVSLGGSRRDRVRPGHEDATPERLRQARRDGSAHIDAQGVRRVGDPFDLLHARNLLDRENPECNALLWQAGDRLRGHWHRGRLDPLTAFDFSRESVDSSGGAAATGPTEAALRHRDAFRQATDAVGVRLMPYVTGIVVDARTVADLRALVSDTGHARTAEALVVERLREGLHRLCDFWRMKADHRPRRMGAWRKTDEETRIGC
jgi:hypothetical protein